MNKDRLAEEALKEVEQENRRGERMKNVWLLTICHRHGNDTTAHATEASALNTLEAYCVEYWNEVQEDEPLEIPLSQHDRIDTYFEYHPREESYNIVETPVQA